MTDEIMYELMKLSGQEYVDQYAQRGKSARKDKSSAGPRATPAGLVEPGAASQAPSTDLNGAQPSGPHSAQAAPPDQLDRKP
jgi:1-acyl-sn-glycerol-3-phosphate acyltransferase